MPIYEYKCNICGHTNNRIVSFDKKNDTVLCTKCGTGNMILQSDVQHGYIKSTESKWLKK